MPIEDLECVQTALSMVINALASGMIDNKRATALLYGLQLASMNAEKYVLPTHRSRDIVRAVESSPEGIDLAVESSPAEVAPAELPNFAQAATSTTSSTPSSNSSRDAEGLVSCPPGVVLREGE